MHEVIGRKSIDPERFTKITGNYEESLAGRESYLFECGNYLPDKHGYLLARTEKDAPFQISARGKLAKA